MTTLDSFIYYYKFCKGNSFREKNYESMNEPFECHAINGVERN